MKIRFVALSVLFLANATPASGQCPPLGTTPTLAPITNPTAVAAPDTTNPTAPAPTASTAFPDPAPSSVFPAPYASPIDCTTPPPPPTVVNGACGTADGVAVSSTPTINLCTAGTATSVSGSGPWNWSCLGSNGGTDAQCTAPVLPPPPPPSNTIIMGEPAVFVDTDGDNGGLLLVQDAQLTQMGTIQSLSFYVVTAEGQLRLALYDAKGTNGNPRNLLAQTAPFTPTGSPATAPGARSSRSSASTRRWCAISAPPRRGGWSRPVLRILRRWCRPLC